MSDTYKFLDAYLHIRVRTLALQDPRVKIAEQAYKDYYATEEGQLVDAAMNDGAEGFLRLPPHIRRRAVEVTVGYRDVVERVRLEIIEKLMRDN